MDRYTDYYKSFEIIIRNIDGQWKSAGWFPHYKEKTYSEGSSQEEAAENARKLVDDIVAEHYSEFQTAIKKKHTEYLKSCDCENIGTGSIQNRHRVSHCHQYGCKRPVDNTYDIECASCGWIVCARCGSCGCGVGFAGRAKA